MPGLEQNNQKDYGSNQDSHGALLLFAFDASPLQPTKPMQQRPENPDRQRHHLSVTAACA